MPRAEGGAKIFGVFRVKNHDFTPKNHIFSDFRGGAPDNYINNQKDQSSNELQNTVEQENTSAAIQNKDNKNQSNNNIPEQKSLNLKNGRKIWN